MFKSNRAKYWNRIWERVAHFHEEGYNKKHSEDSSMPKKC